MSPRLSTCKSANRTSNLTSVVADSQKGNLDRQVADRSLSNVETLDPHEPGPRKDEESMARRGSVRSIQHSQRDLKGRAVQKKTSEKSFVTRRSPRKQAEPCRKKSPRMQSETGRRKHSKEVTPPSERMKTHRKGTLLCTCVSVYKLYI